MSVQAEYHARLWLDRGRTDDEIRAEIARERTAIEAASRRSSMGGSDGFDWVRVAHKARTAIRVYETELAKRAYQQKERSK